MAIATSIVNSAIETFILAVAKRPSNARVEVYIGYQARLMGGM